MIRTLERYVAAELVRTFLIALVALTFVFFLGTTFRLMKDELTYWQILKSLPYAVPYTLPHSLPMAFLVAIALTYGRHVADRELLALESCGVAPRALAPPALALGVVLCLASLVIQAAYLPYCHRKKMQIQRAVLEELLSLGEGEHWSRSFRNMGFDIYVRRHQGRRLDGVVIHRDVGEQPATITAEHGEVGFADVDTDDERVVLTLTNAITTVYTRDKTTQGARDPVRVRLPTYVQEIAVGQGGRIKVSDYSTSQLRKLVRQETASRHFAGASGLLAGAVVGMDGRLEDVPVEIATRAAVATSPLVFLALAFPLTLALRSSNRLVPLVAGIAASSAFYFAPFLVGRTLADQPHAWPGWCFLGDACGLLAAAAIWPLARGGAARARVEKPLGKLSLAVSHVARLLAKRQDAAGPEVAAPASVSRSAGHLARRALARGLVCGLALALVPLAAGRRGIDLVTFAHSGPAVLPWPIATLSFALLGGAAALVAVVEALVSRRGRGAGAVLGAGVLAVLATLVGAGLVELELLFVLAEGTTRSFPGALAALSSGLPFGPGLAASWAAYLAPPLAVAAMLRVRGVSLAAQIGAGAGVSCGLAAAVVSVQRDAGIAGARLPVVLAFMGVAGAVTPLLAALAERVAAGRRTGDDLSGTSAGARLSMGADTKASAGFSVWNLLPIKTLDRMILRRFAWTYAAFAASVLLVFIVTDIFNKFYRFTGENRSIWIVLAEYYVGIIPEIYYMLGPFVTLIAALWVVFELRRNNELTPLMAAGIPPRRIVAPLFAAAFILAAGMFVDRETVIPALRELRRETGKFGKRDHRIPVPIPDTHEGVLAAESYLTKNRELYQPKYVRLDASGREVLAAFAAIASYVPATPWKPEGWLFEGGVVVHTEHGPDGQNDRLETIPKAGLLISMDVRPIDVESAIDTIDYLSTEEMEAQYARIPAFRHLGVQLARRYSYPASCLVLLILGLPFMLRGDRSAAALGILICIAVCALFFIVTAFSEDLGGKPWGPPPVLAAWLPNFLFGIPGIWAFSKAAR